MMIKIWLISLLWLPLQSYAHPTSVSGKPVSGSRSVTVESKGKKGLVVVFLSSVCPCSNSHVPEIANLSKEYPEFAFVGVHSNTDETKNQTVKYFDQIELPFPVIQDNGAKIADEFKASRTPHAFVVLGDGSVAYQGGVTDSQDFSGASRKYLREALASLKAGEPVKITQGRPLGCAIGRGDKNAW